MMVTQRFLVISIFVSGLLLLAGSCKDAGNEAPPPPLASGEARRAGACTISLHRARPPRPTNESATKVIREQAQSLSFHAFGWSDLHGVAHRAQDVAVKQVADPRFNPLAEPAGAIGAFIESLERHFGPSARKRA